MKELFYYNSNPESGLPLVLALQLGEAYAGFTISDKSGSNLYRVAYCIADEWDETTLLAFFDKYGLSQEQFYEVQVAWAFSFVTSVPARNFQFENATGVLTGLYGAAGMGNVVSESVPEWQLQTSYVLPVFVTETIKKKFPAAKHRHLRSLLLKKMISEPEGILQVVFETDRFMVVAAKHGRLLLAQTYEYACAEDVLYYLLRICNEFSLAQQEVVLQLSGLFDKQSALYRELYQYFIHVKINDASWGETTYPAHFFTSFNYLAQCAS